MPRTLPIDQIARRLRPSRALARMSMTSLRASGSNNLRMWTRLFSTPQPCCRPAAASPQRGHVDADEVGS